MRRGFHASDTGGSPILELDSAEELVEYFLMDDKFSSAKIAKEAASPEFAFSLTKDGLCNFVFRGQANKDWGLLPTAFRQGDPLKKFTPQSKYSKLDTPADRHFLRVGADPQANWQCGRSG